MSAKRPKRPAGVSIEDWRSVDVAELADADFAEMGGPEKLPPAIRRAVGQRGPGKKPRKEIVKIRLDPDIVETFRTGGDGWQTRINEVLRKHIGRQRRHTVGESASRPSKRKRA